MSASELLAGVRLLTHASVRLESAEGTVVYIDPYDVESAPRDAAAVLVTHDHYDHFSPEDIAKVASPGCVLVVPRSLAGEAAGLGTGEVQVMQPGDSAQVAGLTVEADAAYNVGKRFHPQANGWLGYVVELDGRRVFHMGDTDQNPDNENVACDVLLIPCGGTFTMDVPAAADCARAIKPKVIIPMHYGSVAGDPDCGDRLADALAGSGIDVAVIKER